MANTIRAETDKLASAVSVIMHATLRVVLLFTTYWGLVHFLKFALLSYTCTEQRLDHHVLTHFCLSECDRNVKHQRIFLSA